jgi:hypothetical protein
MWAWLAHHRGPMGHWHGNIPVYDEATKLKQQCGGVESYGSNSRFNAIAQIIASAILSR